MKLIISPAKALDFKRTVPTNGTGITQALFLSQATTLNEILKTKSPKDLSDLMKISDNLGALNYQRNQMWQPQHEAAVSRQAIYAFNGEVYRGLDAYSITSKKAIEKLNGTVRILSGLYGLLKPSDLIQPYRLEMGTKLAVGTDKNLYAFWKKIVTHALNEEFQATEFLLNLSSNEYFKAIDTKALKVPVVTAHFKDLKNGQYKTIVAFTKRARGSMARYIIDNHIDTIDGVKGFSVDGYHFSDPMSSASDLVFIR